MMFNFLSKISGAIWQWLAAAAGMAVAVLWAMLKVTEGQRDKAREKAEKARRRAAVAEAQVRQKRRADAASKRAKREGDEDVKKAVGRARDGRRDHFDQ